MPLPEAPAAAAGGTGGVILGGVRQDLQLAEHVHNLPGGAPAGMLGGALDIIHHAEYLGCQGGDPHQCEKEAPTSHRISSNRTFVLNCL